MNATQFQFGPDVCQESVTFSLWAPTAQSVELSLPSRCLPMEQHTGGWWRISLSRLQNADLGCGDPYQFRIDGDMLVPDPAARAQESDVHGPSLIPGTREYAWQTPDWHGRPWHEAVVYELHVGTFTPAGTFDGVRQQLPYLVDMGITAIELMPIADFPGRYNWGYDGVLHFAPDTSYGTPGDLKHLIDEAHSLGIMVLLDVVYNHFGPDGNYLYVYAQDFFTDRVSTPWGQAIDYSRPEVRSFFIQNALYWLHEFRFDGLRFDAVQEIHDETSPEHFLVELSRTIQATIGNERHVHLVLENDSNQSRYLKDAYRAQWNDDYHHLMHHLLTGESGGYYQDYTPTTKATLARLLSEGFIYQGDPSPYRNGKIRGESTHTIAQSAFLNFLQNHDQIGNRAFGERIHRLANPAAVHAAHAALLLSPQPPMLYMGEEWSASTPFLFFCDFDPELAEAVRTGRQEEFARFPEFSDPAIRSRIPDPNADSTYVASRLDWEERFRQPHRSKLYNIQGLIELRHQYITPLLPAIWQSATTRATSIGDTGVLCVYYATGSPILAVAINLGSHAVDCAEQLQNNAIYHKTFRMLWSSCGRESVLSEPEWYTHPAYCTRVWLARSN